MNTLQFDEIVKEAPDVFADLLGDLRDSVLEAARAVIEETQDTEDGGKPKVRVAFGLVIDLSKSPPTWQLKGSVSVKHSVESEPAECDDHPRLPGMDDMTKKVSKTLQDFAEESGAKIVVGATLKGGAK